MNIKEKRKKIIDYVLKHITTMEPSGINTKRYEQFFKSLTDEQFSQFMQNLKDKKVQLYIYAANMKINMSIPNILKTAEDINLDLFERIWLVDDSTGKKYLTPNKYLILNLPVRRVKQYHQHKISVPENDNRIDALSGQVIDADKTSSLSQVEIQSLFARDLKYTIIELIKPRGGDINAWMNLKRQMEENGESNLTELESNTVTRSALITEVLFKGMHLNSNIVTDRS